MDFLLFLLDSHTLLIKTVRYFSTFLSPLLPPQYTRYFFKIRAYGLKRYVSFGHPWSPLSQPKVGRINIDQVISERNVTSISINRPSNKGLRAREKGRDLLPPPPLSSNPHRYISTSFLRLVNPWPRSSSSFADHRYVHVKIAINWMIDNRYESYPRYNIAGWRKIIDTTREFQVFENYLNWTIQIPFRSKDFVQSKFERRCVFNSTYSNYSTIYHWYHSLYESLAI